jgi:hypothetical protein
MEWVEVAQDTDRWWTLVNAVVNLRHLRFLIVTCLFRNGHHYCSSVTLMVVEMMSALVASELELRAWKWLWPTLKDCSGICMEGL